MVKRSFAILVCFLLGWAQGGSLFLPATQAAAKGFTICCCCDCGQSDCCITDPRAASQPLTLALTPPSQGPQAQLQPAVPWLSSTPSVLIDGAFADSSLGSEPRSLPLFQQHCALLI